MWSPRRKIQRLRGLKLFDASLCTPPFFQAPLTLQPLHPALLAFGFMGPAFSLVSLQSKGSLQTTHHPRGASAHSAVRQGNPTASKGTKQVDIFQKQDKNHKQNTGEAQARKWLEGTFKKHSSNKHTNTPNKEKTLIPKRKHPPLRRRRSKIPESRPSRPAGFGPGAR